MHEFVFIFNEMKEFIWNFRIICLFLCHATQWKSNSIYSKQEKSEVKNASKDARSSFVRAPDEK